MSRQRTLWLLAIVLPLVLLPWLARFLCGDLPDQADAVVVLAGGRYTTGRVVEGLRLVAAGYATTLIVSGVEFDPRDADFATEAMRLLGDRPVIVDSRSRITRGTSLFVSQLARVHNWKRILVVTSEFHWRRTRALFRYDQPPGLDVRICTVRDVDFSEWWRKPVAARLLKNELWFLLTFYLFHTPYGIATLATGTVVILALRRLIP